MTEGQREKLEEEMNFLKESFESDVITQEEFEKGKERVEKKINELQEPANPENTESSAKKAKQKTSKKKEEKKETEEKKEEQLSQPVKPKKTKWFLWTFFILVILVSYLAVKVVFITEGTDAQLINDEQKSEQKTASSPKASYIILYGDKCTGCDTARVEGILKNWFPGANPRKVEYLTAEGKGFTANLGIDALPAYVFTKDISGFEKFREIEQAFLQKGDFFVLSPNAAGAAYHFKREEFKNRIYLFIKEDDINSMTAKKNAEYLARESEGDVLLETYDFNSALAKELDIGSVPAFVINNIIELKGVHSPDTLKHNFCMLNDAQVCSKPLPKSLI